MRNNYPIEERVFKIDTGEYVGRYIFPSYSAGAKIYQNVDTVIVGAINGNRDPLVKAFEGGSRVSGFKLANARKIRGYDIETIEVPADIKAKVVEYNTKMPQYLKSKRDTGGVDKELVDRMMDLSADLVKYFER